MPEPKKPGKLAKTNKNRKLTKANSSFLDRVRSSKVAKKTETLPSKDKIAETVAKSTIPRLLFAMDATASRSRAWQMAQEITIQMFEAIPDGLEIALAYHSGSRARICPFTTKYEEFYKELIKVDCIAGLTKTNEILEQSININRLKVIIYVGDCYEENLDVGVELAQRLKKQNTKIFFFHDAQNSRDTGTLYGREAMEQMAEVNGGAVFNFDSNSPEIVAELLAAIAYYAAQGLAALKKLKSPGAIKLLKAIDK